MNTGIAGAPAGSPVMTEEGPVRGTNVFGILGYLGIPYGAPSVAKMRWMPPRPHGMFSGCSMRTLSETFAPNPTVPVAR